MLIIILKIQLPGLHSILDRKTKSIFIVVSLKVSAAAVINPVSAAAVINPKRNNTSILLLVRVSTINQPINIGLIVVFGSSVANCSVNDIYIFEKMSYAHFQRCNTNKYLREYCIKEKKKMTDH